MRSADAHPPGRPGRRFTMIPFLLEMDRRHKAGRTILQDGKQKRNRAHGEASGFGAAACSSRRNATRSHRS